MGTHIMYSCTSELVPNSKLTTLLVKKQGKKKKTVLEK